MRYYLRNARQAFNVWKPFEEGGKYNVKLIIPKDHPAVAELEAAFVTLAKEAFGAKWDATLKAIKTADKTCLHNGDAKAGEWEGFEDNLYVSASSDTAPSTYDGRFTPPKPTTKQDGVPYSGCYCDASLELWVQNNDFGKRINCQLRGIMFRADGDAFSGQASKAEANEFQNDDIAVGGSIEDADPLTA